MTMDAEERRRAAMSHEGQVLMIASQHGIQHAGMVARVAIDGTLDGLIRIEGHKAAALYAFALADRVAGGIGGETVWQPNAPTIEQSFAAGGVVTPKDWRIGDAVGESIIPRRPLLRSEPFFSRRAANWIFGTGILIGLILASFFR